MKLLAPFLFALIGCSSAGHGKFIVGFSQINSTDPWRVTMNSDLVARAGDFPDIELIQLDAGGDTAQQVTDVETLRRRKIDLLIVAPEDGRQITPVVKWVYDAGIPVIVIDRELDGDSFTTFVGADNVAIGRAAGALADSLLGGQGNIAEIEGKARSPHSRDRSTGFREAVARSPGLRIVHDVVADWSQAMAAAHMEAALRTRFRIDLVFAHNDAMALGAQSVVAGTPAGANIRFIGIDALPGPGAGRDAVASGVLTATFTYPTGGKAAIEIADQIRRQERVPHRVILPSDRIMRGSTP